MHVQTAAVTQFISATPVSSTLAALTPLAMKLVEALRALLVVNCLYIVGISTFFYFLILIFFLIFMQGNTTGRTR